jgi:hypothetical protein
MIGRSEEPAASLHHAGPKVGCSHSKCRSEEKAAESVWSAWGRCGVPDEASGQVPATGQLSSEHWQSANTRQRGKMSIQSYEASTEPDLPPAQSHFFDSVRYGVHSVHIVIQAEVDHPRRDEWQIQPGALRWGSLPRTAPSHPNLSIHPASLVAANPVASPTLKRWGHAPGSERCGDIYSDGTHRTRTKPHHHLVCMYRRVQYTHPRSPRTDISRAPAHLSSSPAVLHSGGFSAPGGDKSRVHR